MSEFSVSEPVGAGLAVSIKRGVNRAHHADKSMHDRVDVGCVPPLVLRAHLVPVLRWRPRLLNSVHKRHDQQVMLDQEDNTPENDGLRSENYSSLQVHRRQRFQDRSLYQIHVDSNGAFQY